MASWSRKGNITRPAHPDGTMVITGGRGLPFRRMAEDLSEAMDRMEVKQRNARKYQDRSKELDGMLTTGDCDRPLTEASRPDSESGEVQNWLSQEEEQGMISDGITEYSSDNSHMDSIGGSGCFPEGSLHHRAMATRLVDFNRYIRCQSPMT